MKETDIGWEDQVIGSICLDDNALGYCVRIGVTLDWFVQKECRVIYDAMTKAFSQGRRPNILDASEALRGCGFDPHTIDDICDKTQAPFDFAAHVESLRGAYLSRQGKTVLLDALESIKKNPARDAADTLAGAKDQLGQLLTVNHIRAEVPLHEVARAFVTEIETGKNGVHWPIQGIENILDPLKDELVYIAAQPSVGKTAFGLFWASKLDQDGTPSSFASLESSVSRCMGRVIANRASVNMLAYRRGFADHRKAQVDYAVEGLKDTRMRITDAQMNIDQLVAWGRIEKEKGSRLLQIDNFKHIRPVKETDNMVMQYIDISGRLKSLRDETGLPVVCFHHLTDDGKMYWSRDLKKDADIVIHFTVNEDSIAPSEQNSWTGRHYVDLTVEKNRDGMAGVTVQLEFDKEHQRFSLRK